MTAHTRRLTMSPCHLVTLSLALLCGTLHAQTASSPAAPSVAPYQPFAEPATPINFDDYFVNKALRLEFYEIGDAKEETVTLHHIFEEPLWPENPQAIIPPFDVGKCAIQVYDAASNRLIYAHGFDTMYAEYSTTTPAIDGVKRVFERALHIPMPKKPVRVVFARRDKANRLQPKFTTTIDPADYHIITETVDQGDTIFEIQNNGDPHDHVDFAYLSEGYTAADKDKFKADVVRFSSFLFSVEPYKSAKDRISIRGVFRPSPERGTDQPRQHSYKSTILDSSYNAFDLDRYLLVEDDFTMHRMAAQVPYDALIILVNSNRYGGGSIALDYCVASVDGPGATRICTHELGHSFAFLADEYVGAVAYNDMYPPNLEPLEPNITEFLDPANIKWKAQLTPGVKLPTTDRTPGIVGAFEGAGYLSKGMYRPQYNCLMGTAGPTGALCPVCQAAISRMIDYYAPPSAAPVAAPPASQPANP